MSFVNINDVNFAYPDGTVAIDNISLNIEKGERVAIVGQNGAGKTTAVKMLNGLLKPTSGDIVIDGWNTKDYTVAKMSRKVGYVFQNPMDQIFHNNVYDEIEFGPKKIGYSENERKNLIETALELTELSASAKENPYNLPYSVRKFVTIASIIAMDTDVIIMDEPTAALTDREIEKLFEVIENLKKNGVGIIYISHRMEELKIIADRATVMRDGKYIDTVNYKDTTNDDLIKLMVGRDITEQYPARNVKIGEALLEVEDLSYKKHVKAINFSVKKGEILGVAGLMGSGRTEMAKVIFGAYEKSGGKVFMEGKEVHIKNPKEAIKLGIAYLTEDRKKDGLFLNLSIEDNIMIANLNLVSDKSVVNKDKSENITKKYIEKMKIKTPSKEQFTKNLSGGNQQKVILARWLCQNKKIVIFDEPTRGIDVGAKREVYNLMNELVETGAGIIMISSELPEILGMSDRVMIMHEGKIGNIIDIKDATEERILYFATGGINKYEKE